MIPYQTTDVSGPIDLLENCSKPMVSKLEQLGLLGVSSGTAAKAIDISFHHINETMDPVLLTAGMKSLPSTTCDDCPPLDYLIVGGPDPSEYKLSPRFVEFIQAHVKAGKVLFTTCTGGVAVAPSGVLDGKRATTNHCGLPHAQKMIPNVKWEKKQWVVDGNLWTAGGACAGMDMMAHWVIENYGMDIAKLGFELLDFEPREVDGGLLLPRQHYGGSEADFPR